MREFYDSKNLKNLRLVAGEPGIVRGEPMSAGVASRVERPAGEFRDGESARCPRSSMLRFRVMCLRSGEAKGRANAPLVLGATTIWSKIRMLPCDIVHTIKIC